MCLAAEEEPGGSTAGSGASVPEILVTAPRVGIDLETFQRIDWAEVGKAAGIGAIGGLLTGGNLASGAGGGVTAGAAAVEALPGVDLEDLFVIKNDLVYVPGGYFPYMPIY